MRLANGCQRAQAVTQPTPYGAALRISFDHLFSRLQGPQQSAFGNNLARVWASSPEAGRQFTRTDAAKGNVLGVRCKCNRNQSRLRAKRRVPVAYITTAYLAFSGFWACIKIHKLPIINTLAEFGSPPGTMESNTYTKPRDESLWIKSYAKTLVWVCSIAASTESRPFCQSAPEQH